MPALFFHYFFILSAFQCGYCPSADDVTQSLFITVLGRVPRITFASLVAHVISQATTLLLQYLLLRLTRQRGIFFVSMATMIIGQCIDSALFFTGSFYGDTSLAVIGQMILVSLAIKAFMVFLSSLLVAWAQARKESGYVQ